MNKNIYELLLRSEETHKRVRYLLSKYHLEYFDFKSLTDKDQEDLKKLLERFSEDNNEIEDNLRLQNKFNIYKKLNLTVKVILAIALTLLMVQSKTKLDIILILLVSFICSIYIFFNLKWGLFKI